MNELGKCIHLSVINAKANIYAILFQHYDNRRSPLRMRI
jgi:hypothetical protein